MKKPVLTLSAFFTAGLMIAQTTLLSDNFDSYTAGMGVAEQSSDWDTWDGSASVDGEVSADYAFSGANSAKIEGTGTDLVLPVGPFNSGKYDVKFKMLIPSGSSGAYFNALHQWASNSTTYQWAVDVFFDASGNVTWTAGGADGGGAAVTVGEWFDVQITADMDNDLGKVYFNGVPEIEWQWSLNNANGAAGLNQIAAVDFYGTNASNGSGLYYVDDVQLIQSTGVGITEPVTSAAPAIYPNPAADFFTVALDSRWVGGEIRVMDLVGRTVETHRVTRETLTQRIEVANLPAGIYLVKVIRGEENYTAKVTVRH